MLHCHFPPLPEGKLENAIRYCSPLDIGPEPFESLVWRHVAVAGSGYFA